MLFNIFFCQFEVPTTLNTAVMTVVGTHLGGSSDKCTVSLSGLACVVIIRLIII